jgi:hypothetical protein
MTTNKTDLSVIPNPPTPSFLRRVEVATIDKLCDLLDMPKKPKAARLAKLTPEQEAKLRQIEDEVISNYAGDLDLLESVLGMLRIGHHYGWRVLYLIHSKQTIRKYEEVLGERIRDIFPETGPSSYRSVGLNLADRYSNFWKVVGGEFKIARRKSSVS